jgi:hypothetical protein
VLLEGGLFLGVLAAGPRVVDRPLRLSLGAGLAMLAAGGLFYAVGMQLAPCAYLRQFTAGGFLLKEATPWALGAALAAPLGVRLGAAWRRAAAAWRAEQSGAGRLVCGALAGACWCACWLVLALGR